MSVRTRRVAGEIQKAIGEIIGRDHGDVSGGLVTVTDVDVSPDLRNAKVFVSVFGGAIPADKVIALLNDRTASIRKAVGRKVYLRYVPVLVFVVDATGEKAERITRLINEWHEGQQHESDEPNE